MDIKSIKSKIDFGNPAVLGTVISIVLFIVIMGIYYYFIYSGLRTKASQKQTELSGITAKYNSYLELVASYPLLLKQDKKLNKEFAGLLSELPSKKNIPQLLMKISNYEKMLNLNLKMFKPGKGAAKGFYETVPFSMNISGDFYNVYKFFYKLAFMKRIVDVHDVAITRTAKGHKVAASFNGTAFSFIGAPPAGQLKTAKKNGGAVKK
ncbi:MAG: type 4a pilus biogenesis protein PilO [Deltaproteobacteria bacterium]|jgi:Tfp pilus assembly protein PilO|nr:type 4a pilus biogenesis protein PilO [Deltaproteobacteria bacterium]